MAVPVAENTPIKFMPRLNDGRSEGRSPYSGDPKPSRITTSNSVADRPPPLHLSVALPAVAFVALRAMDMAASGIGAGLGDIEGAAAPPAAAPRFIDVLKPSRPPGNLSIGPPAANIIILREGEMKGVNAGECLDTRWGT
jgi:hypothetical protein